LRRLNDKLVGGRGRITADWGEEREVKEKGQQCVKGARSYCRTSHQEWLERLESRGYNQRRLRPWLEFCFNEVGRQMGVRREVNPEA